jgi:hypothetical protein
MGSVPNPLIRYWPSTARRKLPAAFFVPKLHILVEKEAQISIIKFMPSCTILDVQRFADIPSTSLSHYRMMLLSADNGHGPPWYFTQVCPQQSMKLTPWFAKSFI